MPSEGPCPPMMSGSPCPLMPSGGLFPPMPSGGPCPLMWSCSTSHRDTQPWAELLHEWSETGGKTGQKGQLPLQGTFIDSTNTPHISGQTLPPSREPGHRCPPTQAGGVSRSPIDLAPRPRPPPSLLTSLPLWLFNFWSCHKDTEDSPLCQFPVAAVTDGPSGRLRTSRAVPSLFSC